jgi:hypothetical protein
MTLQATNTIAPEMQIMKKMVDTDYSESSAKKFQLEMWNKFRNRMTRNRNLFRAHKPAYASAFKIQTRRFNLAIYTDSDIVKSFLVKGMNVDAVYQITFDSKSLVGAVFFKSLTDGTSHNYQNNCLLAWEKAFVSLILNAYELGGPWVTLLDMLLSINQQDSTSRLANVFDALNISSTDDFSDIVSVCGQLFMSGHLSTNLKDFS